MLIAPYAKLLLNILLGVCSLIALTHPTMAQPTSPGSFFGIRIGEPLDQQIDECVASERRWTAGSKPCWQRVSPYSRTILLPHALQAVAATLDVRRVTEVDGRMVEVELEFRPEEVAAVERYLLSSFGKPAKSETYERHGRGRGLSKHRALAWHNPGVTIQFVEVAASDNGSARAYLDSWANEVAAKRHTEQAAEAHAIEAKFKAMDDFNASPIAALEKALQRRDEAEVKALLTKRFDLSVSLPLGATVLHTAAVSWGDIGVLKRLVDAGAPINARNDNGQTPLHAALDQAHYRHEPDGETRLIAVVDFFLSRKADIDTQDKKGSRPVTTALARKYFGMAEHLLKKGVKLPTDALLVALEWGITDEDFRRYPLLLEMATSAHINARGRDGKTLLHWAVRSSKTLDFAGGLINYKVDLEARDHEGQTPLGEAVSWNNTAAMNLLAERGANLNTKTNDGGTLLHIAASNPRAGQLRWLIERGADVNARNQAGARPLDVAIKTERFTTRTGAEKLDIVAALGGSSRDIAATRKPNNPL